MERNAEPSADGPAEPTRATDRRWLVLNPTSGSEDHVERVREMAEERGYRVEETESAGHAVELARKAGERGVDLLAAAGGDGTLHEVIEGLDAADALDDVTLGVVPTGTANIFAENVGVTDPEQAFSVIESGETRRIDVGMADDEPFVMSCIAGLTADASVATSSELKARFGSLAFVITGIQEAMEFDGLRLEIDAFANGEETRWVGEALCVLIGNVRRFAGEGGQANAEDGLFDVTIVERMPTSDVITEAAKHRLFGKDTEHVVRMQASQLEIDGLDGEPITFSLDGEMGEHESLTCHTRPRTLSVYVGPDYDPDPVGE